MIEKRTYIPSKPRNKKLVKAGGGSTGMSRSTTSGEGMTSEQLAILNNLASWWKLDEDGNLYTDLNVYSMLEVSAYGKGLGGLTIPPFEITDPTEGQALQFNGTHWVNVAWPGGGGGGSTVSWGTTLNGYSPLTVEGLSKTVALSGHAHAASDITSGILATARLGSGTPSASNFLRGDGTWATPAGATYTAGNGLTLTGTVFSLPVTVSGSGSFVQSVAQNTNGLTVTLGTPPNTTYSAGNGLTLSGTAFSLPVTLSGTGSFVTGVSQTTNGLTVTLGTPTNTTYTAGNGLTLSGTAFSLPITLSGAGSFVTGVAQTTNGLTVTLGTPSDTTYSGSTSIILSGSSFQRAALTGDVTSPQNSNALTLANSGVTAGTYNNVATQVRPFTVDAKGRITSIGTAVTIAPAWGSVTGKPTTLSGYGISSTDTLFDTRYLRLTGGTITGDLSVTGFIYSATQLNVGAKIGAYNPLRAEVSIISPSDNPSEIHFGQIASRSWTLTARGTSEGGYFGLYDQTGAAWRMVVTKSGNVGIGNNPPSAKLDVTGDIKSSLNVTSPKFSLSTGWTFEPSGTEMQIKYNGVLKHRMLSDGSFVAVGEITAYGAASGGASAFLPLAGGTMTGDLLLGAYLGATNLALNLRGNAFKYNTYDVLHKGNIGSAQIDIISLGNGWTIEQTAASLTIKRNGVVKYTVNA